MKKINHIACFVLAGIILFGTHVPAKGGFTVYAAEQTTVQADKMEEKEYFAYLAKHSSSAHPQKTIRINALDYLETSEDTVVEDDGIITTGTGTVTFGVTVPESGLYNICFDYYSVEDYGSSIERTLLIDGKIPFLEAEHLTLTRIWKDDLIDNSFSIDENGDQMRPQSQETFEKQTVFAEDILGYSKGAFYFYFSAGDHTITLQSVREKMKLEAITLTQQPEISSYQIKEPEASQIPKTEPVRIEAERIYRKSHASLNATNDSTSPITSPQSSSNLLMNMFGGSNWNQVGQWVEWEFNIKTAGWYQIDFRFLQNINVGLFSTREIRIDEEVPFAEASQVTFLYDNKWQQKTLGDQNGAYAFYFDEGRHTIRLKAVLGEWENVLNELEGFINELNTIYREILFITGVSADPYRTYNFESLIPETIKKIQDAEIKMEKLSETVRKISGRSNSYTGLMDRIAFQLKQMGEDPEEYIASNFSTFKTNIGSLSSQLATMKQQPLALDYILIQPYGAQPMEGEASIFARFGFSISQFFWSFFRDYSVVGTGTESDESIVVWSSAGRDQTQILQQMIYNTFAKEKNVSVSMQLVPPATLLPAVLAGTGPDVALFNEAGRPVEFAVRGAVADLTKMDGYSEVAARFNEEAIVPYMVDDRVYALPETQNIPVLFYRTDIFAELELSVPKTWDDFYDILSVLQRNNMNAGVTMDMTSLCMLLFQKGGDLYNEEGTRILLDENAGLSAFKQLCEFYTKYKLPPSFVFVDRFRSGEMPIAIQDYSAYTQLSLSAPEIKGLWEMSPIPGFLQEDGEIQRIAPTTGTAVMMLGNTQNKNASWEFMKWWTSADVQHEFSEELSILLGEETFFATANTEAFLMQQWTNSQRQAIMTQREQLKGIPNVPGGYYTTRYLSFALANVYNLGVKPTEEILSYVEEINEELVRKRAELNLLS